VTELITEDRDEENGNGIKICRVEASFHHPAKPQILTSMKWSITSIAGGNSCKYFRDSLGGHRVNFFFAETFEHGGYGRGSYRSGFEVHHIWGLWGIYSLSRTRDQSG